MTTPTPSSNAEQLLKAINALLAEKGTLETRSHTKAKTETRLTAQFGTLTLRRDRATYAGGGGPRDTFHVFVPSADGRTKHSTVFRYRLHTVEICKPGTWLESLLTNTPQEAGQTPAPAAKPAKLINSVFALGDV